MKYFTGGDGGPYSYEEISILKSFGEQVSPALGWDGLGRE